MHVHDDNDLHYGTKMTIAATSTTALPTPVLAAAPELVDAKPPKDPLYKSRWERSFAVSDEVADRIEAIVAQKVPFDKEYPNPQRIQTVYVRPLGKAGLDAANKNKFRIRTYPDSPGPPTLIEFKDTVIEDGKKIKKKTRLAVAPNTPQRLLWGESAADIIPRDGLKAADLVTANRAIKVVDGLNTRPVVRQEYTRSTYEDAKAGVRVTFDRNIAFTGVGELIRAGSNKRNHNIMDVKILGKTPPWLAGIIDAETAAKNMYQLEDGKGSTAIKVLQSQMPPKTQTPSAPPAPPQS